MMKQWQKTIAAIFLMGSSVMMAQQKELYANSVKAYEAKDYKTYLKLTKALDSLRPFHPTYSYNLASAYALNGSTEKALVALKQLVMMNNKTEFEKDADFKSLLGTPGMAFIEKLKASQDKVITTSKKVVSLSEKELHPEGLTYLAKSKTWLAGSIRKRKIVSFDPKTGKCTDWLTDPTMLAVFAMKADAKEEVLWVATSVIPEMENYNNMIGKGEILKIDLKTKLIIKRLPLEGNHVFGDLTVAKNGVVYVSDSATPVIYKIDGDRMAEWASLKNEATNLQGLILNTEENKLYIADYLKGIAVISLEDGSKKWLNFLEGTIAKGIDGLVFYKNSLIAIQNGVKPIRIVQFELTKAQNEIGRFTITDNNRPEFDEPAQATVVGDKLYFFANSPWKAYDANGKLDPKKVENPVLYSLML